MFVLACALRTLDDAEIVDFTRAMIGVGTSLDFGPGPIADKHCIGGVPGNRTTMIVVPILAALGVTIPKTSSRAITSPAGTADTMGVLAEVALPPEELRRVVREVGGCIAWGGALDLAPADDILITVERPMEFDTEPQMIASILAKKKTAGATHVLIDIPVGAVGEGPRARGRRAARGALPDRRRRRGPPRRRRDHRRAGADRPRHRPAARGARRAGGARARDPDAPSDLREKSLYLARVSWSDRRRPPNGGYHARPRGARLGCRGRRVPAHRRGARRARRCRRSAPPGDRPRPADGRIREIDCWEIARVAKRAGAPANVAAGVRLLRTVGDVVEEGEPLFEIHAQSAAQLEFALAYAAAHPHIVTLGF